MEIGSTVLCKIRTNWSNTKEATTPVVGSFYTVRGFFTEDNDTGYIGLYLEEIRNDHVKEIKVDRGRMYEYISLPFEPSFNIQCFEEIMRFEDAIKFVEKQTKEESIKTLV